MKKTYRHSLLIAILLGISAFLFITGKRHEIYIYNNTGNQVKYSINGEPYEIIGAKKKIKTIAKGINNNIYLKNSAGKVIDKDLELGISKDIEILIDESFSNSENWYRELNK